MKTLYIVRHAKSSWEYEGINDIDRPLKKRGINDAYLVSGVLQKKIETPAVFVSSCANRALHTAMIFSYAFNYPLANLKISKSLYSFSDGYLIKTVKALDNETIGRASRCWPAARRAPRPAENPKRYIHFRTAKAQFARAVRFVGRTSSPS